MGHAESGKAEDSSISPLFFIIPMLGGVLCIAAFLTLYAFRKRLLNEKPDPLFPPTNVVAPEKVSTQEADLKVDPETDVESTFVVPAKVDAWGWMNREGINKPEQPEIIPASPMTNNEVEPSVEPSVEHPVEPSVENPVEPSVEPPVEPSVEPPVEQIDYIKMHSMEEYNKSINAAKISSRLSSSEASSSSVIHKFMNFICEPIKATSHTEDISEAGLSEELVQPRDPDMNRKAEQCILDTIREPPLYPHDGECGERNEQSLNQERPKLSTSDSQYPIAGTRSIVMPPLTARIEKRMSGLGKRKVIQVKSKAANSNHCARQE